MNVEFYCACGARLAAPAGTPSVQCPNCRAVCAVPPPPDQMAAPAGPLDAGLAPSKKGRYLVSGIVGVAGGIGLLVWRFDVSSEVSKGNYRAASDFGGDGGLTALLLIGLGMFVAGIVYLVKGLTGR